MATHYYNVMESLVAEELERQMRAVPLRLRQYLNPQEAAAFALNRLPALYATTQRGWNQQKLRARRTFSQQIVTAVRQGLTAVQRSPFRSETPLPQAADEEAQTALQHLKELLQCHDLTWKNLPQQVAQAIVRSIEPPISDTYGAAGIPSQQASDLSQTLVAPDGQHPSLNLARSRRPVLSAQRVLPPKSLKFGDSWDSYYSR